MPALTLADRVAETTTTTGTGTLSLGGIVGGAFRTFVAGAGTGAVVPYVIVHRTANEWEVGYGTVTDATPDTLSRTAVYASSNANALVSFSAGTKDVFLALPASRFVHQDTSGNVGIGATLGVTGAATLSSTLAMGGAITWSGDTNLYRASANVLATDDNFVTAGRIETGTGGVYVGSPDNAGKRMWIWPRGTNDLALGAGGADRVTILSTGNVGIGTASPVHALEVVGGGIASTDSAGNARSRLEVFTNGQTSNQVTLGQGLASPTDNVAYLYNHANTALAFGTNNTERARITAGGYFKASNDGTYVSASGTYHEARQSNGSAPALVVSHGSTGLIGDVLQVRANRNTTNNSFYAISYYNDAAAAFKFRVADSGDVTNTNGVYGTISDEKLKQDITDAGSQWDDLKAVRFRKYRFKTDVEAKGKDAPYLLGVVAQELRETSPGLVDAHPDMESVEVVGEDGETRTEQRPTGTETLSVKQSVLLMKAAVALQEAMARIETLEARLDAMTKRAA